MSDPAAFLRAVGGGDIDTARFMLAADPSLANAVGPHPFWGGQPQALHVAIETGRWDVFLLLLDAGADPNGRNGGYDLWSPLMLTISHGRDDMREELRRHGARIGLVEALLLKDDAALDVLLADGLSALVPNNGSILAFARTPYAIDLLLELGAPAAQQDRWGVTPVEAMSRAGADGGTLVRHMMRHGVNPDPETFARLGDLAMLTALVETDPDIARRDEVVIAAVESGSIGLVRWLLSMGGNANARAAALSRQTALHNAAWRGDLDMVQLLAEAGADLHARDAEHEATPRGWAETAAAITSNPHCLDVAAWLERQGG